MKTGNIGVTSENIFPVIKKFLYSDHEIFLREIVSNAVDATQKLKTLAGKGEFQGEMGDLKVQVSVDKDAKTITVKDNGIGMTADEIDRYINQIAFSGATDFLDKYKDDATAIIGHFGLGFYSSFMVSDRVDIITKSYQDAPAQKWSCDGSPSFTLEESDKQDRGTEIVMHISDDCAEYLDNYKVEQLLKKYCHFLPVPVVFGKKTEWKDGKQQETDEDNVINSVEPLWTKKPSDLKDEDYKEFYRHLYPMQDEPLFWIHLNVDYPFNLTGILYFPKIKNQLDMQRNRIQLYCNQVFVTDNVEGIVPDFLMLLHGVIDSPDIPLNVSRSYLQSDSNVKKISSYISKKVSDRLKALFNNDRPDFEQKWDDIKIFIHYGMLSEDDFYAKAEKFFLLKDTNNKHYTLEEYKTLVSSEQTDKDGNLVILYANDKNAQYSQIKAAEDKGYNVLLMDGQLDSPLLNMLEQKLEKTTFTRVDADVISRLIKKDDAEGEKLSEDDSKQLSVLFQDSLPKEEKITYTVLTEPLGETVQPVTITQSEYMRRMKDMSRLQPGMAFYGEMPDSYNVLLNTDNALIKDILAQNKANSDQKDERISQLIDLALLQNGMLKGEALAAFVQRTMSQIK